MPRHPRVHAEGLLYHVKARGNDGQKIFLSQSDYQALIEALRTGRRPRVIHVTWVLPGVRHLASSHRYQMSRSVEFDSEQINEYVWRRMVMFNTANVASPNFGTKIYDHLSPWTASPSAAAAV
jgi:hypothetical protein